MRLFLATLAVALFLLAGWMLSRSGPLEAAHMAGFEVAHAAPDVAPVEALARVPASPGGSALPAARVAAQSVVGAGVERPPGFAGLIIRVRESGRPLAGAFVTLADGVDAILNRSVDENGPGVTDARGEVAFHVRPTRTARVHVTDPVTGWTAEGIYATPFEGRRRVVVLNLNPGEAGDRISVIVSSELDGGPLAGVAVEALDRGATILVAATTDEEGAALLPGSSGQEVELSLDGFAPKTVMGTANEQEPLRVVLRPLTRFYGQVAPISNPGPGPELRRASGGAARAAPGSETSIVLDPDFGGDTKVMVLDASTWASLSMETAVNPDGTWSIDVAIPPSLSEWTEVRVTQMSRGGASRTIVTVPRVRPGDSIEVHDPWRSAPPLWLRFTSPLGKPILLQYVGQPLTVTIAPNDTPGSEYFQVALVEAGGEPESLVPMTEGEPYTFPFLPTSFRAQLVLFGRKKPDGTWLRIGGRNYSVKELQRVPIYQGQHEAVLHL